MPREMEDFWYNLKPEMQHWEAWYFCDLDMKELVSKREGTYTARLLEIQSGTVLVN